MDGEGDIAKLIRDRRKALGLTQDGLAKLTGYSPATISNYESGVHVPRGHRLKSILKALNCDPGVENIPPPEAAPENLRGQLALSSKIDEFRRQAFNWERKSFEWETKAKRLEMDKERLEDELRQIKSFLHGRYVYQRHFDEIAEELAFFLVDHCWYRDGGGGFNRYRPEDLLELFQHGLTGTVVDQSAAPGCLENVLGKQPEQSEPRAETIEKYLAFLGFNYNDIKSRVPMDTIWALVLGARFGKDKAVLRAIAALFDESEDEAGIESPGKGDLSDPAAFIAEYHRSRGEPNPFSMAMEDMVARLKALDSRLEAIERRPAAFGVYHIDHIHQDPEFILKSLSVSNPKYTETVIAFKDESEVQVKNSELFELIRKTMDEGRNVDFAEIVALPSAMVPRFKTFDHRPKEQQIEASRRAAAKIIHWHLTPYGWVDQEKGCPDQTVASWEEGFNSEGYSFYHRLTRRDDSIPEDEMRRLLRDFPGPFHGGSMIEYAKHGMDAKTKGDTTEAERAEALRATLRQAYKERKAICVVEPAPPESPSVTYMFLDFERIVSEQDDMAKAMVIDPGTEVVITFQNGILVQGGNQIQVKAADLGKVLQEAVGDGRTVHPEEILALPSARKPVPEDERWPMTKGQRLLKEAKAKAKSKPGIILQ